MNIYIHSYIYFIYNGRPAVNIFTIVYYLRTKYSRQQNLVTSSTADVCQPVAEPVRKCIKKNPSQKLFNKYSASGQHSGFKLSVGM